MMLSGHARLAGVIGWPVAHSRSPRLHGTWLARHGIDGAYLPLPVRPEDFSACVMALVRMGFAGANVTIPHKEAAFAVCDTLEDSARRAGAVNTLVFGEDGAIRGANTDGAGFLANLRAHGVDPAAGPALVLGAGGAARAIGAALADASAKVTFCNRTRDRAATLAAELSVGTLDWEQRHAALADHALVVNTTSLGMVGHATLDLSLDRAAPGLAVADIVYVPLETPLLAEAASRGLKTVEGLGMLLHQAVPGFTAWFGVTPVVDVDLYRSVAADLLS
ncbi:MAG TPA: shikimate dehydrogenase [Acidiphilium sp.]